MALNSSICFKNSLAARPSLIFWYLSDCSLPASSASPFIDLTIISVALVKTSLIVSLRFWISLKWSPRTVYNLLTLIKSQIGFRFFSKKEIISVFNTSEDLKHCYSKYTIKSFWELSTPYLFDSIIPLTVARSRFCFSAKDSLSCSILTFSL